MKHEMVDVVVGGASGMGAAAAEALKSERPLLIVDKSGDIAAKVAQKLGAEAVECDITDPAAVQALADRIPALGSMIISAGVNFGTDKFQMDVNLVGPARLLSAMKGKVRDGSSAVLFSSMVELYPQPRAIEDVLDKPLDPDLIPKLIRAGAPIQTEGPGQVGYLYAKVGIIRLMRLASIEWWKLGGRVNSITPGVIETPMLKNVTDPAGQESMMNKAKLVGRLGRAEEVGRVAAFLASEEASFVNGVNVTVAGGLVTLLQEQQRTED